MNQETPRPRWAGSWAGYFMRSNSPSSTNFIASALSAPSRRILRTIVIAASCTEVLTLWHALRRYMVGLDGSLTLQHAAWTPPLNPWLLLVVNAAGIAWLAALALGSHDGYESTTRSPG